METFSSKEIIKRLKIGLELSSDNALADTLGVSKTTLSNWKSRNSLDFPLVFSLCERISLDWLLTGKGDMLKSDNEKLIEAHKTFGGSAKSSNKQKGIPLIPIDAVAGFPSDDNDGVYMEDCEHYSIPEFEAKGANFLIRVSGDSMHPLYENGDIIACRKISDILFFQWGSIYVLDTSQGALVKRVEEAEDDKESILCISENPRFKPFRLPKSDIRSLSTIVGLVRLV